MSCYPSKHRRMAFKGMKFDTSALMNQSGNGLNGTASGLINQGIEMAFGPSVRTDKRGFQTAASKGTFATKGVLQGAATGAQFGVPGAIVGGVLGGVKGLFEGKAAQHKADRTNDMLTEQYSNQLIAQGNSVFQNNLSKKSNSLYRSGGRMYPSKTRMFSEGGVIMGGELHENFGNPVVDAKGNTIAETEREELILGSKESELINRFIDLIDQNPSEMNYAQLGQLFVQDILPNLSDNSGKFSLNKARTEDLP